MNAPKLPKAVTATPRETDICFDQLKRWLTLPGMGAANLVALLAQAAEEIAIERPDVDDWQTAHRALDVAAKAVDLPYAEPEEDPTPAAVQDAQDRIIRRRARPSDYDLALG